MIKISFEVENNRLTHLTVRGHGGLEYGKDVICAGVSACLVGALNALNHSECYSIHICSGDSDLKEIQEADLHDKIVLETLIVQLQTIADSYPRNVEIVDVSRKEGKK